MDYKPGTTELTPDLAEATRSRPTARPTPSSSATASSSHNGRELTADDVKYSLDRVTNPKTQSPGAGFFKSIKGFDDIQAARPTPCRA